MDFLNGGNLRDALRLIVGENRLKVLPELPFDYIYMWTAHRRIFYLWINHRKTYGR